jgi:hypothetical protein
MNGQDVTLPATPAYTTLTTRLPALTPVQRQKIEQRDEAKKRAQWDVTAAGLSPQQEQQQKAQAPRAEVESDLALFDQYYPGAPKDQRDIYARLLLEANTGIKAPTLGTRWVTKTGTINSQKTAVMYDEKDPDAKLRYLNGQPVPDDLANKFTPDPTRAAPAPTKAWTVKNGRYTMVLLDRETNQPIPGSERTDILPPSYMIPRISTGVYHWADENGQLHETPETRSTAPVLPGVGGVPGRGRAAVAPRTPAGTGAPAPGASGDRILGSKGTPALNKAKAEYGAAVKLASLADKLVADAETAHAEGRNVSEQDTLFVLNAIKAEAGRVNQQEIDRVFKAGGIQEGPSRLLDRITAGELSDDLRRQIQHFAHQLRDASQDEVKALTVPAAKETYRHYATNAQKHRIGTDDDPNSPNAKWYDVETGNAVK